MLDILQRLYRIARASAPAPGEVINRWFGQGRQRTGSDTYHSDFDSNFYSDDDTGYQSGAESDKSWEGTSGRSSEGTSDRSSGSSDSHGPSDSYSGSYPEQVVADLALFGLTPPSSLEQVKKARNREIKKYHSDRFINDPKKFKTSNEIMQTINAAYTRLKQYYSPKG